MNAASSWLRIVDGLPCSLACVSEILLVDTVPRPSFFLLFLPYIGFSGSSRFFCGSSLVSSSSFQRYPVRPPAPSRSPFTCFGLVLDAADPSPRLRRSLDLYLCKNSSRYIENGVTAPHFNRVFLEQEALLPIVYYSLLSCSTCIVDHHVMSFPRHGHAFSTSFSTWTSRPLPIAFDHPDDRRWR
jgi:hypothetical protein